MRPHRLASLWDDMRFHTISFLKFPNPKMPSMMTLT